MGILISQVWRGNAAAPYRQERRNGKYDAYVPHLLRGWHPSLPSDTFGLLSEADQMLRSTAVALGAGRQSGLFFWSESLGSSHIEGIAPSAKRVVHEIAKQKHFPDRTSNTLEAEVVANIAAAEAVHSAMAEPGKVTVKSICYAHKLLMDASPHPHLGGHIRSEQNWIGGSGWHPLDAVFVPPPPDKCHELMNDLVGYLHTDQHPPLLHAGLSHAYFETIHPFGDGNGRIGRALLHGILKYRCAPQGSVPPLSLALSRRRDDYINALHEFQSYVGDHDNQKRAQALVPWLEVLADAVVSSCVAATGYLNSVFAVQKRWREKIVGGRKGSAVSSAIDHLPFQPSMTVKGLQETSGFSYKRCADALRALEAAGVLTCRTIGPSVRAYDADEIFEVYNVMASTGLSGKGYEQFLETTPIPIQAAPPPLQKSSTPAVWNQCSRSVQSTGLPCGLAAGHGGHCRRLPHRKRPPRQ